MSTSPVVIFKGQDLFGQVEVTDLPNVRTLTFGNQILQSVMPLDSPFGLHDEYSHLMMLPLLFGPAPKNVLMLGLGGGILVKFLWKNFPLCHIDAVERSSLVVDVAQRYFGVPKSSRLKIFCDDALDYVAQCEKKYDLIMIDLFHAEGPAELIEQGDFFTHCQKLLKNKNSFIIWNTWNSSKGLFEETVQSLSQKFGQKILMFPTRNIGNLVFLIFNQPRKLLAKDPAMLRRALKLEKKTGVDFLNLLTEQL